ncbi:uncharacterized protein [Antedon mediterranea]|uniref:uncharacterized protein n=1 Tax=Antedon mediterranea TaxID=105859 RepID=UPI003AF9FF68
MAELERTSCFDESFHVSSRFCSLKFLGSGSSGLTVSALDTECDKNVAIKKVLLNNMKDRKSALREVRILRQLEHDNIVKILDVFLPTTDDGDKKIREQIYIVQELCDVDLKQVIDSECLKPEHVKLFTYQILRGLKYLHSANVVHRDLKPSNLFVNNNDLTLKIGDFGLARVIDPLYCHKGHLTDNITTRCYRSPELMLHPQEYDKAIDMWAVGCIVAEMLTGKMLFAGEHDLELMGLILDSVPLTESDINDIICTLPSKLLKNYNGVAKRPLCELVPINDKQALHLIQRLLVFCPQSRISAKEALAHPYLKVFSDPQDEKTADYVFKVEDEVVIVSPTTLRKVILTGTTHTMDKVTPTDEQEIETAFELKLERSSNLLDFETDMQDRFSDFEKDIDELSLEEFKEEDDDSEKEDLSEKSDSSNKDELEKTDDELEWYSKEEIDEKDVKEDDNVAAEELINEPVVDNVVEDMQTKEYKNEKVDEGTKMKVQVPEEITEKNHQTDEEKKAARIKLFEDNRLKSLETSVHDSQSHIILNNSDSDSDKSDNSNSNCRKNKQSQMNEKCKKNKKERNQLIEGQQEKIIEELERELPTEKKQLEKVVENRSTNLENSMKNKGNEQANDQTEKAFVVDLSKSKVDRSVRQKHKSPTLSVGPVVREKTLDDCLSLPPRIERSNLQSLPQRVHVSEHCCGSSCRTDGHQRECNCTALSKINKKLNERLKQEYAIRHRALFDASNSAAEMSRPLRIEIPVQPFLSTSPSRLAKNTSPKDKSVRPKRKKSSPNQRGKFH